MKRRLFFIISLFAFALLSVAQDAAIVRKKNFNLENGIAIGGYDPVAYFNQNKAVKGKKDFAFAYQGAIYYFSSSKNAEEFKNNVAKYEPQYGGWCAFAMGNDGTKVQIDPETFKITNGKLYVFYNKYFTNTLKSWNKNEATLMKNADNNWVKLYH